MCLHLTPLYVESGHEQFQPKSVHMTSCEPLPDWELTVYDVSPFLLIKPFACAMSRPRSFRSISCLLMSFNSHISQVYFWRICKFARVLQNHVTLIFFFYASFVVTVIAFKNNKIFDQGESNNFIDCSCSFCIGFTSMSRFCWDLALFFACKQYSSLTPSFLLFFISNGSANTAEVLEIAIAAVTVPTPGGVLSLSSLLLFTLTSKYLSGSL